MEDRCPAPSAQRPAPSAQRPAPSAQRLRRRLAIVAGLAVAAADPTPARAASDAVPDATRTDLLWVEWGATDRAAPTLVARAPLDRDASYELEIRAMFGPLSFTWIEGPWGVAAGTSEERALVLPAEVYLDPLASAYVTRLVVFVHGGFPDPLEHVFVAWPDGPEGAPVVWSREDLAVYAPLGVVDPGVEAEAVRGLEALAADGSALTWIEPPLYGVGRVELAPDRDGPPSLGVAFDGDAP